MSTDMNEPIPIDEIWHKMEMNAFGEILSDTVVGDINEGILEKVASGETEFVLHFTAEQPKDNIVFAIASRKFYNSARAYEVQFLPSNMVSEEPLVFAEGMVIVRWL